MGDNKELQEEELEVLKSIYEGDGAYRSVAIINQSIQGWGAGKFFSGSGSLFFFFKRLRLLGFISSGSGLIYFVSGSSSYVFFF